MNDLMEQKFDDVTYVVEEAAAIITINRPERYNCLLYTSDAADE